ncbi:stretch-activated cation channel mid1 [Rhodotorula kratochvilovae]
MYRRRPPRAASPTLITSSLLPAVLLVLLAASVTAQTASTISDPSTTTITLGSAASAFFHLALPASSPVWVSLSLCSPPPSLSTNDSFALPSALGTALFLSNSSAIQAPGPANTAGADGNDGILQLDDATGASAALVFGYANATLDAGTDGGIWIGVLAPDAAALVDAQDGASGDWTFELQVSSGTPLAPYVADGAVGFRLGDSDATSALLSTANFTAAGEASAVPAGWSALVEPTQPHALALGRSRCALRNAAARTAGSVNVSATTRGYGGGTRTQFVLDGLERGTNYTAWLVSNETMPDGGGTQTRVWDPLLFATKSGDSCRLVYDVEACPSVAYSVPSPLSLDTVSLVSFFNDALSASLANFSRTLTTFPCGSKSMGLYSIVSTCEDCYAAYRDWLCATTLPRCTDAPPDAALNDTSGAIAHASDLASWFIPEEFSTALVRDDPAASRTPLFGPANLSTTFPTLFNASYPPSPANTRAQSPFPYAEVPPCLDVCYLVEARCPPFLGWTCPRGSAGNLHGGTGSAAYGLTRDVPDGLRMAGDVEGSGLDARAGDRLGNVFL